MNLEVNKIEIYNKLSDKILSLVALAGDFPAGELKHFGSSLRFIRRTVQSLTKDKMLISIRKNGIHSYRLTKKAKKYLLAKNPERYEFFVERSVSTNYVSNELTKRLRLQAMAEIWLLMLRSEAVIYRDKKSAIFENPHAVDAGVLGAPTQPTFYSSREVKEIPGEAAKIKNSRSVGLLLTSTNVYIIYHTSENVMKWYPRSETKLIAVCNYLFSLKGNYGQGAIKGIMIGKNMGIAAKLLDSTGGFRKQFFMVDNTFEHLYFVPNDESGIIMLKFLTDEKLDAELREMLSEGYLPQTSDFNVENDAISEDGCPVLFAYDFDFVKIKRFVEGVFYKELKGIIYCFDFQKDVIANYCCDVDVVIHVINLEKVKEKFNL